MSSIADAGVAPMSVGPGFFRDDMPLDELQPSPLNPRKHFDQAGLEELAASIRELGIIEPLVARPVGDHYELVAGERRYRAAKLAGLEAVPCTVKRLSAQQALEIMVVENNQREDVNALEEADGFSRLVANGYDVDRLAERLGRSKKYVYDRIKLLDLAPPAKQLLLERVITPGHGILLARLKPEDQLRALDVEDGGVFGHEGGLSDEEEEAAEQAQENRDDRRADDVFSLRDVVGMKPNSVRETAHWIARHVRFKPHEAAAAAPLEYGETAARVDQALLKPGRGKKVIAITLEHYIQPEARDEAERTYGPRAFKFADGKPHRDYGDYQATIAKTCEHAVLGVVAVGQKYGQAFEVCIARDKCPVHWKKEIAGRRTVESAKGGRAPAQDDGRRAQREREENERRERERLRREKAERIALNRIVDSVSVLTPELLRLLLAWLMNGDVDTEGFNARFKLNLPEFGQIPPKAFAKLNGRALNQAVAFCAISQDVICGFDAIASFKAFGVDLKSIEAQLAKEEKAAADAAASSVQTSAQTKPPKKPTAKKKR